MEIYQVTKKQSIYQIVELMDGRISLMETSDLILASYLFSELIYANKCIDRLSELDDLKEKKLLRRIEYTLIQHTLDEQTVEVTSSRVEYDTSSIYVRRCEEGMLKAQLSEIY